MIHTDPLVRTFWSEFVMGCRHSKVEPTKPQPAGYPVPHELNPNPTGSKVNALQREPSLGFSDQLAPGSGLTRPKLPLPIHQSPLFTKFLRKERDYVNGFNPEAAKRW